jgi:transcriptional regulator with PAS, ATPase and Fis domain
VHVNCGSIPETLFESEMFGYERGSFTGASSKGKRGLVEAADGGTLFLDEIAEIPLASQAKMLQFIESAVVQRVGATQPKRLQVNIVAATNRKLTEMVGSGTFRKDLFYRISVVTIRLPPLRECPEVMDRLIDSFLANIQRRRGDPLKLDSICRQVLKANPMPGNIRQLQNVLEHLAVVCAKTVRHADLQEALAHVSLDAGPEEKTFSDSYSAHWQGESLGHAVRKFETEIIRDAIARTGSKRKAAALLGVDIATISRKSRRSSS